MKSQNTDQSGPATGTNKKKLVITRAMLLAVMCLPLATAQAAVYNFQLQTINTAVNAAGSVIAMTGAGNFDTSTGDVMAKGSFTTYNSSGVVTSKGTWTATDFVSFDSTGGVNPGFQTGLLAIKITLRPQGAAPVTGVPMSVLCDPDEVPGPVETGELDGTTVGDFTTITGGFSLFQLIHP